MATKLGKALRRYETYSWNMQLHPLKTAKRAFMAASETPSRNENFRRGHSDDARPTQSQ